MNTQARNSKQHIIDRVQSKLSASLTGEALLQSLRGIHPLDVEDALDDIHAIKLFHTAISEKVISLPVLHEITRDDNPVLSFWPFTKETAQQLAMMCRGHKRVALLGVPTVFSILRNTSNSEIALFESDNYHFLESATPGFIKCDLVAEVPSVFDATFDLVIGDPPWYKDEYLAWLETAARLLKPAGKMIFIIFPEGIRDAAVVERESILSSARELFCHLSLNLNAVKYESPSFEQVEMLNRGISPMDWRSADLIVGYSTSNRRAESTKSNVQNNNAWVERRIGCGRLFLQTDKNAESEQFLSYADSRGIILSSPSRRAVGRNRANVLSSRGHGLCCNNNERLVKLIEAIKDAEDIDSISMQLTGPSREIFRTAAKDLWGRFILCSPPLAS